LSDFPSSIREINRLDIGEKKAIYRTLIPNWLLDDFNIDRETLTYNNHSVVSYVYQHGSRAMEITLKQQATDRDPLMYLNMVDTFNNQLLVLLVVVNDPESPRFNIDIDEHGNNTNFGTSGRNIPAEIAAMQEGLAPGQVKRGLRAFKRSVPIFEEFVSKMGHELFLIEPLAYHNAIIFERYGFNYVKGLRDMEEIHSGFLENGEYRSRLQNQTPFRHSDAWWTVRGRAWAIHDGILGHPFTGFQMYKRIGIHAGLNTFPEFAW